MTENPMPETTVVPEAIAEKFWAKVRANSPSECWLFTGATSTGAGYGSFSVSGETWLAHRLAHYLATGELPEVVMHSCDNPPCCNPAHLSSGTYRDNARDSWQKGRQSLRGRLRELSAAMREVGDRPTPFTFRSLEEVTALESALQRAEQAEQHGKAVDNLLAETVQEANRLRAKLTEAEATLATLQQGKE